jgi:hypothetical protein
MVTCGFTVASNKGRRGKEQGSDIGSAKGREKECGRENERGRRKGTK